MRDLTKVMRARLDDPLLRLAIDSHQAKLQPVAKNPFEVVENFRYEVRKSPGVRQIDAGGRLAGVPVATGNDGPRVGSRQRHRRRVCFPRTGTVELERVKPPDALA